MELVRTVVPVSGPGKQASAGLAEEQLLLARLPVLGEGEGTNSSQHHQHRAYLASNLRRMPGLIGNCVFVHSGTPGPSLRHSQVAGPQC